MFSFEVELPFLSVLILISLKRGEIVSFYRHPLGTCVVSGTIPSAEGTAANETQKVLLHQALRGPH